MRTQNEIVFEIDEHPQSLSIPSTPDYIGRQLCCALYEPLLRVDSVTGELLPGVAADVKVSPDGLEWELGLPGWIEWSDGKPVTAEDALAGIAAAAGHPTWGRHLSVLESGCAEGETVLRLRLRRPAGYLGHLLSAVDLAPRHTAADPGRSPYSGPYRMYGADVNSYRLVPNEGFPGAADRPPLMFCVNRVPGQSVEGYFAGRYDVTCHTGFPFSRLADCRDRRDFFTSGTGITMQLEIPPGGGRRHLDTAARTALLLAVDREAIAVDLGGGVKPLASFEPPQFSGTSFPLPATPDAAAARAALNRHAVLTDGLRVCFHDYYPNREILNAICTQWADRLGVVSECTAIEFSAPCPAGYDLLFALRFPTFPHAWAQLDYYTELLRSFEPECAVDFGALVGNRAGHPEPGWIDAVRVADLLCRAMPVIPLFEVLGHWLQRPRVSGFRYPPHACFDFRQISWEGKCQSPGPRP